MLASPLTLPSTKGSDHGLDYDAVQDIVEWERGNFGHGNGALTGSTPIFNPKLTRIGQWFRRTVDREPAKASKRARFLVVVMIAIHQRRIPCEKRFGTNFLPCFPKGRFRIRGRWGLN